MTGPSITIKDVAALAGASPATASRVLSGNPATSAESRQRVAAAVTQLDFHPNAQARALRSTGTNVIVTAAPLNSAPVRAGAAVTFTGAVGDDAHGRRILEVLAEAGIDAGHVRVSGTAATGTAVIAVDDQGENQIIVSPGANAGLTAADVEAGLAAVQAGDVLVLQLEIPTALVRQAARTAKNRGAFVILNAAPAPGRSRRCSRTSTSWW